MNKEEQISKIFYEMEEDTTKIDFDLNQRNIKRRNEIMALLKSSLQEQRQSILEEIEKKIKELGIQTDKADTQIQNEDFNEFFSKEDAEKLIHDNLIIIKALEDIKQLLKIN